MRSLTLFRNINWKTTVRGFSSLPEASQQHEAKKSHTRMSGWQIHSYSDNICDLQNSQNLKKPLIRKPSEVLVKILASSVNPIDVAMMSN